MCLMCRHPNETTHHVLNGCEARLGKYAGRYDRVLDHLAEVAKMRSANKPDSESYDPDEVILVDKVPLPEYMRINLRPDLQLMKFINNNNNNSTRKSNFIVDINAQRSQKCA